LRTQNSTFSVIGECSYPSLSLLEIIFKKYLKGIDSNLKRQIDLLIKKNYQPPVSKILDESILNETFNNDSEDYQPESSSDALQGEKIKTVKRSRENLTVNPKHLNVSPYKSIQLDCVYNGPKYLTVQLVWFKNGVILDKNDQKSRYLILDYIQNNTSICILKFSYALNMDAGIYTCIATTPTSNVRSYLNDSVRLVVNSGKFLRVFN
jgi:hypothetical protein